MKDLNEIMVFARVAQLGSFSQAAKTLNMPVSTVSRKVSDLESRLGMALMQRTTRKLNLTKSGAKYYQQCADLLQGLDEAEAQLTDLQAKPEGPLRITVPVGMSTGRFIDFLSRFSSRYPGIQVDVLITNQYVDLVSEGVDVAIRFGPLNDSSLIARRLGTSSRFLVASPDYLRKHGTPKQPQDLKKHHCIIFSSRAPETTWELVREKSRQKVTIKGQVSASDMIALGEFAIRGHGIALLPEMYSVDPIEQGKLKQILPEWTAPISDVHAVYTNRKFMPSRLQIFLRELEEWRDPNWQRS